MSNKEDFLELIPQEVAPRLHRIDRKYYHESTWPVYRMIRCPSHVRDLYRSEQDHPTVIQTGNGTMIYVRRYLMVDHGKDYLLIIDWKVDETDVCCHIIGPSKEAVLETATMIYNLPSTSLDFFQIHTRDAFPTIDLFHWFYANYTSTHFSFAFDSRRSEYLGIRRTSERCAMTYQGKLLPSLLPGIATLPNLQEASFCHCWYAMPTKETLLALALPARKIALRINEATFKRSALDSVHIIAKEVEIVFSTRSMFPSELTVSFLRRMGHSGQLERVSFQYSPKASLPDNVSVSFPENVAQELVRILRTNAHLRVLQFHNITLEGKHAKEVLVAIKQNTKLWRAETESSQNRTFSYNRDPIEFAGTINRYLADFTRFFRLAKEPPAIRQALLGEVLNGKSVKDFQFIASFLEQNVDTLCEILQILPDTVEPAFKRARRNEENVERAV
ncbi:hypothetical protein FisN_13Hu052 [Fistulifera solaris]|uniref:Uncharacterized protein n=1 Tax=Fistulifera solaris TaxID=1519565 RepID=A0A1Z5KPA0_FISSO|nr:hypothetical protein FisN_13Hu052 [Fistulifera solaris]|eukprot:GAX27841.1 hypothetical protein FisN_13Hu052 [Fistulifera solaris]